MKPSIIARLALSCAAVAVLFLHPVHRVNAAGGISLRPPFDGSYAVNSWFDHDGPNYVPKDGYLTIYTGETVVDCNPPTTFSYCYDGHSGIDFALPSGTPVLAVADGTIYTVVDSGNLGYGRHVYIQHNDGSFTLYGHLTYWVDNPGQVVTAGTIIGYSGSTGNSTGAHLHFGLYTDSSLLDSAGHVTDPYGWQGSTTDPLQQTYGATRAVCQWRSLDSDPISCADTIVEDGERWSSVVGGGWNVTTLGNSFQFHYHLNDNQGSGNVWATWAPSTVHGICRIYAWIPANYATTRQLTYWVYGYLSGFHSTVSLNRFVYANQWAYLRTDQLIGLDYPMVSILGMYTGEPINTVWIGADAVKFRCYYAYMPIVLENY
jgi:murein DD-endopeptidase MepM/ murein hydrolase activator NlpD